MTARLLSGWLATSVLVATAQGAGAAGAAGAIPADRFVALGPGAGPIEQVLVHPGEPDLLYLLAPTGGDGPSRLYRSLDGGASWDAPVNGLPYLLAAGGATFVASRLVVDPRYPNVAYLVRSHGGRFFGPRLFVYGTSDYGASWQALHPGFDPFGVFGTLELFFPPSFPRISWARNVAPDGTRFWRSFDGGSSWSLEPGLDELPVSAFEPAPPLVRYRVDSPSNSIERSDDGGLAWRRTGPAPIDPVSIVAVVAGAPDGRVYVGSGDVAASFPAAGVFRSDDAGATWRAAHPPDLRIRDLTAPHAVDDRVYAATGTGLYVSRDGGERWELAGAGLGGPIAHLGIAPTAGGDVLLADSWRSTDHSRTWSPGSAPAPAALVAGIDAVYRILSPPDGSAGTLWRSDDGGATWSRLDAVRCHAIALLEEHVAGPAAGAAQPLFCVEGVGSPAQLVARRSDDRGESFVELEPPVPVGGPGAVELVGVAAARLPDGAQRVVVVANAGVANPGGGAPTVGISDDGGARWRSSAPAGGASQVLDVLLADGGRRIVLSTTAGVLASGDGGASWSSASRGLELAGPITALAQAPASGDLYAGAAQSLYRSRDAGATWQRFDDGARGVYVHDLVLWPRAQVLLLATSHGVLARRLPAAACIAGELTLCLRDDAFRVELTWEGIGAGFGAGRAATVTSDTGSFWFFDPANLELVVKVLDGCALNGRQWVFLTALTDLGGDLQVTRVADGAARRYRRPIGERFQTMLDVGAFACP